MENNNNQNNQSVVKFDAKVQLTLLRNIRLHLEGRGDETGNNMEYFMKQVHSQASLLGGDKYFNKLKDTISYAFDNKTDGIPSAENSLAIINALKDSYDVNYDLFLNKFAGINNNALVLLQEDGKGAFTFDILSYTDENVIIDKSITKELGKAIQEIKKLSDKKATVDFNCIDNVINIANRNRGFFALCCAEMKRNGIKKENVLGAANSAKRGVMGVSGDTRRSYLTMYQNFDRGIAPVSRTNQISY